MKNSKQSLLSYELELYKNLYDEENKYRNDISDRVFKTITVIVSIIGAVIWLLIKFSSIFKEQCCYLQCFNIFLLCVVCITSVAIVFLNHKESIKRIEWFRIVYRLTLIDIVFICITFFIEVFL